MQSILNTDSRTCDENGSHLIVCVLNMLVCVCACVCAYKLVSVCARVCCLLNVCVFVVY